MNDPFYVRFEARFRGHPEEIRRRLSVYIPLLEPFKALAPDYALLDLGCGRGEWLEIAAGAGWRGEGVDSDGGMLEEAAIHCLVVHHGDALAHLQSRPDASVSVVTGFHIAEHLNPAFLRQLISEAHRVLRPGGILLLETPNPENLTVGACSFYMDPGHRAPLPPELLLFLVHEKGFSGAGLLRLNEPPVDFAPLNPSVTALLYRVSPDYAVIAQKGDVPAGLSRFSWPPTDLGGCSLLAAAADFDGILHEQLAGLDHRLNGLQAALEENRVDWQSTRSALQSALEENRVDWQSTRTALQSALDRLAGRQEELEACRRELLQVYASRSWWLTRPLRLISSRLPRLRRTVLSRSRLIVYRLLAVPRIRGLACALFGFCPSLERVARRWFSGVQGEDSGVREVSAVSVARPSKKHLGPGACKIYEDLKAAIGVRQDRDRKD
jgi:O-antigen chain-terminating methyltransferase